MNEPSSPGRSPETTCPTCGKYFTRQEHLRRHLRSLHATDSSLRFRCEICSKQFVRRDALQRHCLTHQQTEPNLLQRGARACTNCATAKIRCSGGSVCTRCRQRNLNCTYPIAAASPSASIEHITISSPPQAASSSAQQQTYSLNSLLPQSPPTQLPSSVYDTQNHPFDSSYWHSVVPSINWLPIGFPDVIDASPTFESSLDPFAWYGGQYEMHMGPSLPHPPELVSAPVREGDGLTPVSRSTAQLATSPTDSTKTRESQSQPGELYVDGEPARLPHVKRRRISTRHAPVRVSNGLLSLAITWNTSTEASDSIKIPDESYDAITKAVAHFSQGSDANATSSNDGGMDPGQAASAASILFSKQFESHIPAKQDLEYLLGLFAKHVLPILPVIHSTELPAVSWQVLTAAMALGSHFVEGDERFVLSIHELVRRILYVAEEQSQWLPKTHVERVQLELFHAIGVLYSGNEPLQKTSSKRLDEMVRKAEYMSAEEAHQAVNDEEPWDQWIRSETCRRTWHAVWLLDCIHAYEHRRRPRLKLAYDSPALPCTDELWAISNQAEWLQRIEQAGSEAISLLNALERLYIQKELPTKLCEFGRVILIHGTFQRTWEVEDYFQQPLSEWTPSASKELERPLKRPSAVWLPANSTFTKWRNSACDCLDVLHWSANATIGEAAGIEHPTVLHLHLARVILLTPYKHFIDLALYLAGESRNRPETDVLYDKQMIRKWVTQDQYKARLAMIHAGVLFWHIRRFSANAFYEPDAVAFASLALWAFSAFSDHRTASKTSSVTNGHHGERHGSTTDEERNINNHSDDSEEAVCEIVLLDRPTDDELVQQFVRSGHKMKAYMKGVGDLYAERGAEKVLQEGRKLIVSLTCWGVRERWVRVLDKLIDVTKQQRLRGNGQ